MGREVCLAVAAASDLELVALVDPAHAGERIEGRAVEADIEALHAHGAEVVVDFSVADAVRANLRVYAAQGIHAVVGTTGLADAELEAAARLFADSEANAVVAPNFAIGAVLLLRFCELAAPHMDGVEVIELHHDAKRDAPSGTARQTAAGIAGARARAGSAPFAADPTTELVLPGARGGEGPGGIRIHSIRLPGLVAHEEVIFGAPGQSLTIRHDSYDRRSFMPGVLLAVRRVPTCPGLTIGLVRERLLQATYDCVARWGLAKTTVEDAARQAGVSRATVYRYFPGGRDELIGAVVGWEFARFFLRLYDEVHDADTLEEVMERGLVFAHRAIVEHEVLQRILVTEPEILLPRLTVEANETHTMVAAFLAPYLARHGMEEGAELEAAADFLARMVLSYIGSPGRWDLEDPAQVARLVRAELLAGIR
jgi:4-hydroxy-tetrahydrodipicolinate reductase